MFEWKVEEMKLMNPESKYKIGNGWRVYTCEHLVSREDKLKFSDLMTNGQVSEALRLAEKFNNDKEQLPKDAYGKVKTVSFKAWIRRNKTSKLDVDDYFKYGEIYILGCRRNIKNINSKVSIGDVHDNFIDNIFHYVLSDCEKKEHEYFDTHDEYEVIKRKLNDKMKEHSFCFGLPIVIGFGREFEIKISNGNGECRKLTKEEIKIILDKYNEFEKIKEEISKSIIINY